MQHGGLVKFSLFRTAGINRILPSVPTAIIYIYDVGISGSFADND